MSIKAFELVPTIERAQLHLEKRKLDVSIFSSSINIELKRRVNKFNLEPQQQKENKIQITKCQCHSQLSV